MTFKKNFLIFLVPVIFLVVQLNNIYDYGINWDNAQHFNRGQAFLYYFLTGEKNYLNLPKYPRLSGTSDFRDIRGKDSSLFTNTRQGSIEASSSSYRRSYYQSDVFNFEYFVASDSGHPPINGIISAITNNIFYQNSGILDDIAGYQISIILVSFLLVLVLCVFVYINFGLVPSLITASSLSLYPLFLAESQFNIKDPIEASFFGTTIISFYFGITKKKLWLIFFSAVCFGLALGTKFNALFLPLIIVPWFIFYLYQNEKLNYFFIVKNKTRKLNIGMVLALLLFPVVPFLFLFATWPYLWSDPLGNFEKVILYYKGIGTGVSDDLKPHLLYGWNTYPLVWFILTTPLPILFLSLVGLIVSVKNIFLKKEIYFLILLWFLIPLIRVSIPGSNIYGGIRQIMEILPAVAILSGLGIYFLQGQIPRIFPKLKLPLILMTVLSFIFILWEDISIHPNQNVYFNQIAGGLSGARDKNIPSWGNSFGNAYMQGVVWLNKNAQKDAKLGLPIGSAVNIPRTRLREDIALSNDYFSGFNREGEYQIELAHDYSPKNWFSYQYLDKFLDPVYVVKIDNVPILKVWKNDLAHTKAGFDKESSLTINDYSFNNGELRIDLVENVYLTRLFINHSKADCDRKVTGSIFLSEDGTNFTQESETLEYSQMSFQKLGLDENKTFFFLFPGKNARFIKINDLNKNSCLVKNPEIRIFYLDNLSNITVNR